MSEKCRSSKSALHGLVHWLSQAYCKKGITVNGVAPALIQGTAMLHGGKASVGNLEKSKSQLDQVSDKKLIVWAIEIPMGRLGEPSEIADTVVWMVKNGYLTNKIIAVDGGVLPQ
jgi:3-oxoacyl-[acyl-carrier protein] reductase